jgi:ABC-2 type transport system permease protein
VTVSILPGTSAPRSSRRGPALLWHQIRYEQLTFWRNPQAAIFTFIFPVVVMTLFGALFRGMEASDYFYDRTALQYYLATVTGMSVLGSCYSQLAIVLSTRRQSGILKRSRATPLPASVYFGGLVAHCVLVSVIDVALITLVGRLYGVTLPGPAQWPVLALTLLLGAASFCAIGVGIASLIRNAEAAPGVVQFILFPLTVLSGTYMPIHSDLMNAIADALPVKPFNEALLSAFTSSSGFPWQNLAVLLMWGAAGAVVAVRRFRWDPRAE